MKKLIIPFLGCVLMAAACTKNSSSTSPSSSTNTTTTTTTSYPNKLTVVDNGATMTAQGVGTTSPTAPMVILVVQKSSTNSVIEISTASNNFDFNLYLTTTNGTGPVSGIGTFVIPKSSYPAGNTYVEKTNGGLSYNIDTAAIITTSCSGTNVTGTFTLWLSNSSGNKTVTGSFNCNQPTIE